MLLRRPQRKASNGSRAGLILLALALTVLVHAAFVGLIVVSSLLKWDVPDRYRHARVQPARPVMLRGLSREEFEKNRGPEAKNDTSKLAMKQAAEKRLPRGL